MRVRQIIPTVWTVDSDSGNTYTVFWNARIRRLVCTCMHYSSRGRRCKHIRFVEALFSRQGEKYEVDKTGYSNI